MNLRKFIAPNVAILFVLSVFWLAGVDSVVKTDDKHEQNLKKYVQVQKQILDNYVEKISINQLYKSSIKGLATHLKDSTTELEGTPLDTAFTDVKINGLRESVQKFDEAYQFVNETYPDENMSKLTEQAIRGMFKTLDPHSIYIRAKESETIEENFEGKFQGVGIQFNVIQDTINVISAIAGGPSDKLGIRSGDRIIAIGDSSAIGFENNDVMNALRGPKGTEVKVTIKRPNVKGPLDFTITRDDIPLYTVNSSYMLDDNTGYIKINRFAATTHKEFMEAVKGLEKQGMQRLMLDLRNNPGGYLGQAIAIAEEFYNKGTKILSTKSRHLRFTDTYFSGKDGELENTPVIVLVNQGSASASEIVSGAIQDHDRGLIVGQRTFGKGLVQQQYGLVDSSNIRVTISRYYTPSGRLIQKPYSKSGKEEYAYEIYQREENTTSDVKEYISHIPDSLVYRTDGGRKVYGGGGIIPDHLVQEDTTQSAAVINFMRHKRIPLKYVRNYLDKNGEQFRAKWEDNYNGFRRDFRWDKEDFNGIFEMLKQENMAVSDTLSEPDLKSDTLYIPKGHFESVENMVGGFLKAELATQVWGLKKYYPVINDVFSDAINKAMNLWEEASAYAANEIPENTENEFHNRE